MDENRAETPRSSLRKPNRAPLLLAAVVIAGVAIWFLSRSRGPDEAPAPAAPPAAESSPAAPVPPAPGPDVTADPADVQAQLDGASSDPAWRSWLAQGDLVRRAAVVIENLREGSSPRAELPFLAPKAPFQATRGGAPVISPASYARYDRVADTIASLDVTALGKAWRALRPAVETAYRTLGTGGSVDAALGRALARIEAAPVKEGEVRLLPDEGRFLYADPSLEELPAVEKHLLRMGPRNTKLLKAKARELRAALGIDQ